MPGIRMKECSHCGAKNSENNKKCQWCGKGFDEPVERKYVANNDEKMKTESSEQVPGMTNKTQKEDSPKERFKQLVKRFKNRELTFSDSSNIAESLGVLIICFSGIVIPYHFFNLIDNVYLTLYLFLLWAVFILSLILFILVWFYSNRNPRDVALCISTIAVLITHTSSAYFFDWWIKFDFSKLPSFDSTLNNPGFYVGFIPAAIVGFVTFKITKKIMERKQ